ncbi:MAG: hypothetical protein AAGK00_18690 [Pseudomonadota bacterium]
MNRPNPRHPYFLPLYMAIGALEGVIVGWLTYDILVLLDFGGIGSLMLRVSEGSLAFWLGAVFFGITFGMLGIAWRIMVLLPDEDE